MGPSFTRLIGQLRTQGQELVVIQQRACPASLIQLLNHLQPHRAAPLSLHLVTQAQQIEPVQSTLGRYHEQGLIRHSLTGIKTTDRELISDVIPRLSLRAKQSSALVLAPRIPCKFAVHSLVQHQGVAKERIFFQLQGTGTASTESASAVVNLTDPQAVKLLE